MATTERPNVVVVMTDDQGYGDLGCHGNPVIETPEMDRLHDEGARLTDFHVSPTCSPTRASLMTGRHKLRTGVWHTIMGRSILHPDEVTMADCFADAGYRTGIFGKWHLGDNYPARPGDCGFDDVVINGGGGVSQTPDHWGNDYFDDTYLRDGEPESFEGYCTDVWFDEAIAFVEENASSDRPFFCYVPTNAAHRPYQVPEEYAERYAGEIPEEVARFYGMITNVDDNLARLTDRLSDLGIAEETVVVFLTDNGSSSPHYNAGMRAAKGSQYEGGHRVPCFVHWPGHVEDRTVDALSAHYDLLPTLADLCGLDRPDATLDGRSLVPLLEGGDDRDDWDDERAIVVDTQRVEHPEKWRNSAVLTERWRLIDGEELYDVGADPGQEHDVAEDHPDVVDDLRGRYEAWWEDVSGRFGGYCRIVLGADAENPADLTCMDWHECDDVPWNQCHVLEAPASNGFWAVEIDEAGEYEFQLRRWPPEADAPIDGTADLTEIDYGVSDHWSARARTIDPVEARLRIGDHDRSEPVPAGASAIAFRVELDAGPAELHTAFVDEDGTSRGAYFVTVTRRD